MLGAIFSRRNVLQNSTPGMECKFTSPHTFLRLLNRSQVNVIKVLYISMHSHEKHYLQRIVTCLSQVIYFDIYEMRFLYSTGLRSAKIILKC